MKTWRVVTVKDELDVDAKTWVLDPPGILRFKDGSDRDVRVFSLANVVYWEKS